jgi:hypothetical protein
LRQIHLHEQWVGSPFIARSAVPGGSACPAAQADSGTKKERPGSWGGRQGIVFTGFINTPHCLLLTFTPFSASLAALLTLLATEVEWENE